MSHSTTQTSVYMLTKYSRSYPTPAQSQQDNSLEWQHYTNPVLRLVLDLKTQSSGQLESARLRVIWSVPSGDPSGLASDITFACSSSEPEPLLLLDDLRSTRKNSNSCRFLHFLAPIHNRLTVFP
ncbi:hypothetical protein BDN72DRAFT_841474 [Pluteus cervinus]|uniref:Uncharacterized protein n=1 Tax=Pluteus cervinus TaxID=181527 RepID=A0ACD3AT27_9AGAR|nr:hypothetical protein BDN72DRAFT_841474 [Pluteus cervinus]